MAIYKICDIRFDIQARYDYTHKLCAAYAADGPADFTIRIPEEKLREAVAAAPQYPPGYHEGLEVYREISSLVPFRDAFLMHSSVVALHGEAYVFTAKSGTGKSTHSRLWLAHFPEAEIVNGDKPLFKKDRRCILRLRHAVVWQGKLGKERPRPDKSGLLSVAGKGKQHCAHDEKRGHKPHFRAGVSSGFAGGGGAGNDAFR